MSITFQKPEDRAELDKILDDMVQCVIPGCVRIRIDEGVPICMEHAFWFADRVAGERRARTNARDIDQEKSDLELFKEGRAIPDGRKGRVYFVRADGLVKIGFSNVIRQRLRAYPPSAEVLLVMPGNRTIETYLHRRFKLNLKRGHEWFEETQWMTQLIEQNLAIYGPPPPELSTERFTKAKFQADREPGKFERSEKKRQSPGLTSYGYTTMKDRQEYDRDPYTPTVPGRFVIPDYS